MKLWKLVFGILLLVGGLSALVPSVRAAITPDQRKELNQIKEDVGDAAKLLKDKKYEDAGKLLDELTSKLEKLAKDADLKPTDKLLVPVNTLIDKQRQILLKQTGAAKGKEGADDVSFTKQIAPLLNAKCLTCHDNNAAGRLILDSFAEMKKGGKSGPLLQLGQPQKSLIMGRLTAPGPQRMPKDGTPLSNDELNLVANWIKQGAKFDGEDENTKLADYGKPGAKPKNTAPVKVAKATGNEKVHFIKDVAPDIVSLCTRCHSGANPRGGYRMVTFEDIMRGGDSGAVVIPGDLDGSRLWELINGGPPRMPPGQLRIRRAWYEKLKVWIEEGAKYDGDDPKIPLARLVPTEEELLMEKLAKLTPDEFLAKRKEQTHEQWKKALSKEEASEVETAELYVYGNATPERLKQIAEWGEEHAKLLRTTFKLPGETIWKGKLAVIVYKDRFGYGEFSQTINNREPDPAIAGHSIVTAAHDDAYVVIEDVGDTGTALKPDARLNLIDQMTGAFLKRQNKPVPEWLIRGTGLAMATKEVGGDNEYLKGLRSAAQEAVRGLEKPDDLFGEGKFSPADMAPIGFTLVTFMIREGTLPKFVQFVNTLQTGTDLKTAINNVYKPASTQSLALGYLNALGSSGGAVKKKPKK